ncbi:unnamed protein product [Boreogadus saida]
MRINEDGKGCLKALIRHEIVHPSDRPFKCPKAFCFAAALKLQDRTHTKESPFLCGDCGKSCRTNSALKVHRLCRRSAFDDEHLICEHCGSTVVAYTNCERHTKYTPEIYCTTPGEVFHRETLKVHQDMLEVGKFIILKYDEKQYVGQVLNIQGEEIQVGVST